MSEPSTLAAIVAILGAALTAGAVIWKGVMRVRDAFTDIENLKRSHRSMSKTVDQNVIPLSARVGRNERDIKDLGKRIDQGFRDVSNRQVQVQGELGELSGLIKNMVASDDHGGG